MNALLKIDLSAVMPLIPDRGVTNLSRRRLLGLGAGAFVLGTLDRKSVV